MFIDVKGTEVELCLTIIETQELIDMLSHSLEGLKVNQSAGQCKSFPAIVVTDAIQKTNCGYINFITEVD